MTLKTRKPLKRSAKPLRRTPLKRGNKPLAKISPRKASAIIIQGRQGTGASLAMIKLAQEMCKKGKVVISNCNELPHHQYYDNPIMNALLKENEQFMNPSPRARYMAQRAGLKRGNPLKKSPLRRITPKQAKRLRKQSTETKKLIEECEGICLECGTFNTLYNPLGQDHILQRGKGGSDDPKNKRLRCWNCHQKRHNGMAREQHPERYKK